jgi:hypothetical protein
MSDVKTRIIFEQFDNGIAVKWDVDEEPVLLIAEEDKEAQTLGECLFEDISHYMDTHFTNKVEIIILHAKIYFINNGQHGNFIHGTTQPGTTRFNRQTAGIIGGNDEIFKPGLPDTQKINVTSFDPADIVNILQFFLCES